MPRLKIDHREIEVPPEATILDAARALDIDIPTLCHRQGCEPGTSCLVCMVKLGHNHRLVPACATAATDGLEVESETDEVHAVRRSALELLLSDHLGDCLAPCWSGCPAQMDIPTMLRQIAAGDLRGAIATVKADIALPAVLGRICPAPCEKVCRRGPLDGAVAICALKRYVADADLASPDPYLPRACLPATGKRVAILGAGPTGLAAAYYLARQGHAVTLFEAANEPGGRLLAEKEATLPRAVLTAEIAQILRLGIDLRLGVRVGRDVAWDEVRRDFAAILVATGPQSRDEAALWGLSAGLHGMEANRKTFETNLPGVFAAGLATRGKAMVVRSVADGKEAARAIDSFLSSGRVQLAAEPFTVRIGRMEGEELQAFATLAGNQPRDVAACQFSQGPNDAAAQQAARCLHCDCRALTTCRLRKYAALYHADPRRYKSQRRTFQQDSQHGEVLYESGKCIDCGLCIQITAAAGEELGLAFVGRGFDVRVGVPLGHSMAEALQKVAAECIAACPTAALAWKVDREQGREDSRQ